MAFEDATAAREQRRQVVRVLEHGDPALGEPFGEASRAVKAESTVVRDHLDRDHLDRDHLDFDHFDRIR